jgi:hypothetical protein
MKNKPTISGLDSQVSLFAKSGVLRVGSSKRSRIAGDRTRANQKSRKEPPKLPTGESTSIRRMSELAGWIHLHRIEKLRRFVYPYSDYPFRGGR